MGSYNCWVCGTLSEQNLCPDCEIEGYWIDPAGGLHDPYETDPLKVYE